jgi:hypothetical protein
VPYPVVLDRRRATRLRDAILSLQPTAYWPLDDGNGPLRDIAGNWNATVTGTLGYGVAAPDPIGRGITFDGSSRGLSSTSAPVPTASLSVLALIRTTNASAATRVFAGRGAASQYSWELDMDASHVARFLIWRADGGALNSASANVVVNDGGWWLVAGSCDGTNVRHHAYSATTATDSAPTAVSTTWHLASTAGIYIAQIAGSSGYIGVEGHVAVFNDKVIGPTQLRWLRSIAFGG